MVTSGRTFKLRPSRGHKRAPALHGALNQRSQFGRQNVASRCSADCAPSFEGIAEQPLSALCSFSFRHPGVGQILRSKLSSSRLKIFQFLNIMTSSFSRSILVKNFIGCLAGDLFSVCAFQLHRVVTLEMLLKV